SPDRQVDLERKVREAEFEAEKAKKSWEAAKDVFDKNARRRAEEAHDATPAKDRDKGRYTEFEEEYARAKKQAEKENWAAARAALDEATRLGEAYAQNPHGARAAANRKLQAVNQGWKHAVSAYLGDLAGLDKAITAKQEPGQDLGPALKVTDGLRTLFDALIFVKAVRVLTDDASSIEQRRLTKERGLRNVRRYRQLLASHPVLKLLRINPFTKFSTAALEERLAQLENALLGA